MTPLSGAEGKTLIAGLLNRDPGDLRGWEVIGIFDDGPVVLSNARDSAVIIYSLAQVIERLGCELADGNDMQAEAIRRSQ